MGFESREYFRDGSYTDNVTGFGLDFTPVVKWLILANVAVFLLQIFVTRPAPAPLPAEWEQTAAKRREAFDRARQAARDAGHDPGDDDADWEKQEKALRRTIEMMQNVMGGSPRTRVSTVTEWCQLSPEKTVYQGQVWRLLTSAFCHDPLAIWHILLNMVMLFWFGTRLESMYGSREFLLFYLAAAVAGSLAFVGLALYTGSNIPAIGASGAVLGVLMVYAIYYPWETIRLFWFFPVPIWILVALYVLFDLHPVLLLLAGYPQMSGIAHAGHLGGLLFGYLYYKSGVRLEAPLERRERLTPARKPKAAVAVAPRQPTREELPTPPEDDLAEAVDEILKKISEQGQASLTEQEKATLHRASARYRGKR